MDTHICKACRRYETFYTKSICSFEKQKEGYCLRQEKATCENYKCELYKYRPQKEKTVTVEHLDIVIADIEKLERIFYDSAF